VIVAPAVDLKGGRCVQLVGGRPDRVAVELPDPVAAARRWHDAGFSTLHVVDLDAALGSGGDPDAVLRVITGTPALTQVGGGVRDSERATTLLEAGASRIVVGTRALEDPEWLGLLAARHPGRVMVAVDVRDGRILRRGWTEETALTVPEYLPTLGGLALAGILSTNVGREGRLEGIDREVCREAVEASPHPVWASGGVTTVDELEYLEGIGVTGVVLGMALYTGRLEAAAVAARWGGVSNTTRDR
jgi:phosphoribosylformimino-5-aminoimidazole carboxamide ribotide isomerase